MKAKHARKLLLSMMALLGLWPAYAADRPLLGAEIWIEPGQTPVQIDTWFRDLADSHMPVARLFLMWPYLESAPNQWNFTLYDAAFRAAEKYHIHIVATLTPSGLPPFLGGDGSQGGGVLPTIKDRQLAAAYIAKVVGHYRSSSALDTWLLVNEPGQGPVANPAAITAFRKSLAKQYSSVDQINAAWGTAYKEFDAAQPPASRQLFNRNQELDWRAFWEDYQTAQLRWLADEVRKSDSNHPLHLNPAGLLGNLAGVSDDLPSWRTFLDTLGCSIHPAWHFGLLNRDQYALGVSYLNDLVRGSIEPKPYWVTELQGGNNIYSGHKPMNPTPQDIAQWVWTSIGSGADRIIFWLLNSRAKGLEAGEWSLLDFQGLPSERLRTAAAIANVVNQHESFFSLARPYHSPITILLSLDRMNFEEVFDAEDDPARSRNAHILSALGFYEALSRLGPPPDIKYFNDYDWVKETKQRRVAILPDARVLTEVQIHSLHSFIEHGNTLLITGLTGFYGPHATAWPLMGFPLAEITGGRLKEVYLRGETPLVSLTTPSDAVLPSHFWISSIDSSSATAIGQQKDEVIATERDVPGGGRVIWIPSPIGLGAWLTDAQPLTQYLQASLNEVLAPPFTLTQPQDSCLLRVLENQGSYLTVLTNGAETSRKCEIKAPPGLHATTLWGRMPQGSATESTYILEPQGTSVQLWQ
jgi:beta-galactosidase